MNNQEVFDKVVEHLYTQRAKSLDIDSSCLYRGLHGRKCAIGALIPDDIYTATIEHTRIRNLVDADFPSFHPRLATLFEGVDISLLTELQWIHDGQAVEYWPSQLRMVGTQFGLDISKVKDYV